MAGDLMTFKQGRVEEDFRVPLDALTTNVDRVVDAVNDAATQPDGDDGSTFCAGQGAPTQVLWFSYAETDLAVTYNSGACNGLNLGEVEAEGGDAVVATFSQLLWQQRASQEPPAVHLRARCAPNITEDTPLILDSRLDLVDAVLCEHDQLVRQARLPAGVLASVNADFAARRGVREPQKRCGVRVLRGVTAWGDRFTWWAECWDFRIQNSTELGHTWQPTPAVQTLLESLPLGPPHRQVTTHPGR